MRSCLLILCLKLVEFTHVLCPLRHTGVVAGWKVTSTQIVPSSSYRHSVCYTGPRAWSASIEE
eukprot:32572-Eustigmatos_ZCMA.PRE.1